MLNPSLTPTGFTSHFRSSPISFPLLALIIPHLSCFSIIWTWLPFRALIPSLIILACQCPLPSPASSCSCPMLPGPCVPHTGLPGPFAIHAVPITAPFQSGPSPCSIVPFSPLLKVPSPSMSAQRSLLSGSSPWLNHQPICLEVATFHSLCVITDYASCPLNLKGPCLLFLLDSILNT